MLFNYIEFLIFFPVADMLYFLLPFRFRWVLLLTASYFFYGYRNPRYLVLIFLFTFLHYLCGIMMGQTDNKAKRRPYLHLGLVGNLGLLFPFKYSGFFTRPIGAGFSLLGFHTSLPVMENLPPQRQGSLLVMLPQWPVSLRWPVYYGCVLLILLSGYCGEQQFIYFRF